MTSNYTLPIQPVFPDMLRAGECRSDFEAGVCRPRLDGQSGSSFLTQNDGNLVGYNQSGVFFTSGNKTLGQLTSPVQIILRPTKLTVYGQNTASNDGRYIDSWNYNIYGAEFLSLQILDGLSMVVVDENNTFRLFGSGQNQFP